MTEAMPLPFDLPAVQRKKRTVDFDEGDQSSDAGLLPQGRPRESSAFVGVSLTSCLIAAIRRASDTRCLSRMANGACRLRAMEARAAGSTPHHCALAHVVARRFPSKLVLPDWFGQPTHALFADAVPHDGDQHHGDREVDLVRPRKRSEGVVLIVSGIRRRHSRN